MLAGLAVNAILAAAVGTAFCLQSVGAAPISAADPHSAEPVRGAPSFVRDRTAQSDPVTDVPSIHIPAGGSANPSGATDWRGAKTLVNSFDSREFELNVSDDKYSDAAACVYPDSYLRTLAGGQDDCGVIKPGVDESEVLTLPFLAICGWAVVILAVAGLRHFYRNWRVRRWLRRAGVQRIVLGAARPRSTARDTTRRTSSRSRPRPRRYAGRSGAVWDYTTDK